MHVVIRHSTHVLVLLLVSALLVSSVYAQQLPDPVAPGVEGALVDRSQQIINGATDCNALYPGDTPSAVNLRQVCTDIKNSSGNTQEVKDTLIALDSAREGVYGCNGIGQYGPVGQRHAGGTYVPVSEEAVALNTFILVNKFCVLDAVARNNRNALVAGLTRAQAKAINEGLDGRPQYAQDLMRLYRNEIPTRVMEAVLRSPEVQGMCSPMRDTLIRNTARRFFVDQTQPSNRIACTFDNQDHLRALYEQGRIDLVGWEGFQQSLQENNHPYLLNLALKDYVDATIDNEVSRQKEELSFGEGFFSRKKCEQVPVGNGKIETMCDIVTPGRIIAESAGHIALAGNRMVESADEINKMVGTMYANLASRILTSNTGFAGTTVPMNGQPSYLDNAVDTAYKNAENETITTGVEALQKAVTLETTYISVRTNSKKVLETAKSQLESIEKTCVTSMKEQAKIHLKSQVRTEECAKQAINQNSLNLTCNVEVTITEKVVEGVIVLDAKGPTIRLVAALKEPNKAEDVTASSIQPMLDVVVESLNMAQKGFALLKQLENQARNATTPQAVAAIIQSLNKLIAAKVLHNDTDVARSRDQHTKVVDVMQNLVERTKEQWEADWCKAEKWQLLVVPTPTSYK